ncbi:hypothetical protein E9993_10465 [Labilibacter sediminis]|nr:hypothetical protein E9993_10465 [Labilibacter sediminis]
MMTSLLLNKLRINILLLLFALTQLTQAQEPKATIDFGGELTNRYVWRGLNLTRSPGVHPYIELTTGNWLFGTWGTYTFEKSPYQEVDLYVSYTAGIFNFTLFDYFVASDSLMVNGNYFDYSSLDSPHAIEAILTISDIPDLPITFTAATFIFGNDYNSEGDRAFSTYLELGYDFAIGDQPLYTFAGVTTHEGLYADGFKCTNIGLSTSKDFTITENLSIPLTASLILNPDAENLFLILGLSF